MSIVYQAGARPARGLSGRSGLSGAPVSRAGLSSRSEVVYLDAGGDLVLQDGSLFSGSYRNDANAVWYEVTNGKASPPASMFGSMASTGGSTTTGKKCCNCVTADVNENWYLASTRRTSQDVPVAITRRKTVCNDPNSLVKINCSQLKSTAGLQGLGSLGCGCDARM